MLEVRHAVLGYPGINVLSDVGIALESGAVVGLLGASGSGKTTLLRCLSGLLKPHAGTIVLHEHMIWPRLADESSIWPGISFVFQRNLLFPNLTMLENCLLGIVESAKPSAEQLSLQLFEQLGISEVVNHNPRAVSEGQRTRTSIIRSLVRTPQLLLMDEPTAPLDSGNKQRLTSVLLNYLRKEQPIIIIASHDLEFLKATANRFLVVKDGAVHSQPDFTSALEVFSDPRIGRAS